MASSVQLNYRSLDELIDSVRIDMRVAQGEGQIEVQELIKVVQRCNYELGLIISQTKETILEVEHGRAKLPADFHFLNFAFLCHNFTVIQPEPGNGIRKEEVIIANRSQPNYSTCPCWTLSSPLGSATVDIVDCAGDTSTINMTTGQVINICAQSVTQQNPQQAHVITATKGNFCYHTDTGGYSCTIPTDTACDTCEVVNQTAPGDPWGQNKVYSICNNTIDIRVIQICGFEKREYQHFEPLYMMPSRRASAFSCQKDFKMYPNHAMLQDNFLKVSHDCCRVYLNYQGVMEDDNGNLMVLDHPRINEYYEYQLKLRILENLYLNGEPDLERRLQYTQQQAEIARREALNIVNTPDYQVMKQTFSIIRQHAMENFAAPLSRFYGRFAYISFIDQLANGRYCE